MSVEGIPQRDQVVTFIAPYASYHEGEVAAFTVEEAARLADLGVVGEEPPPTEGAAPVNTTPPSVMQLAAVMVCTTGTWEGTPTAYGYAWTLDGASAGTDSDSLAVTTAEAGQTAICTVTASNATGSTAAPPTVGVVVNDPGAA